MKQIYTYCDESGSSPVIEFLEKSDTKIRKKFKYQLNVLLSENKLLREPHIKHFTVEKYKLFYEFRIKMGKKVVRIIFCEREENIILLHAFYKRGKRDTENALEQSLKIYSKMASDSLLPFQYLQEVIVS